MKQVIRYIFIFLNAMFAIALVSTYLAKVVNPAKLWIPALLGLLYPYLVLANVVFMVIWIFFKKRFILISLIPIALGFNLFRSYLNFFPTEISERTELKVLTYNVHQYKNYFVNKKAGNKIFEFFEEEQPDILCIQEAYMNSGSLHPAKLINSGYSLKYFNSTKVNSNYGIITYSKFPIIHKDEIRFKGSNNIFNYSDIKYHGDTIRVYNCHLESYGLRLDQYTFMDTLALDQRRIEEFKSIGRKLKEGNKNRVPQIKALVQSIKNCPLPVIVCGDFNDTPVSYSYGQITKLLNDAFVEAGNGLSFTYRKKYTPYRIDYIFYGNEFDAFNYMKYDLNLSDHDPVSASIQYKD